MYYESVNVFTIKNNAPRDHIECVIPESIPWLIPADASFALWQLHFAPLNSQDLRTSWVSTLHDILLFSVMQWISFRDDAISKRICQFSYIPSSLLISWIPIQAFQCPCIPSSLTILLHLYLNIQMSLHSFRPSNFPAFISIQFPFIPMQSLFLITFFNPLWHMKFQ